MTPVFLEGLTREPGFVKKKRKFSGSDLATICIWVSQQIASDPATDTSLSSEGLNKRLNTKEVLFLQQIFSLLFQQKSVNKRKFLTNFFLILNAFVSWMPLYSKYQIL